MSGKKTLLEFDLEEASAFGAKIKVIGVGGGGSNAVNRMISEKMQKVNFVVVNTDVQDLKRSPAPVKVQIGVKLTKGLGAGAIPEIGHQAALEDLPQIAEAVEGADMVFITAGMGGGTGTGASPIVAQAAKEAGALVVAFVTKPFMFEGKRRMDYAEKGIRELREAVDSIVTIPNQRLLTMGNEKMSFEEAFNMADQILCQSVRGISDLITNQGRINLDFADVRTIMSEKGTALMGTGFAKGENKAVNAVRMAISNPLMGETSIDGATGVLLNVTGGKDIWLKEINDAATTIHESVHEDATIIFGMVEDPNMKDELQVMVIATGTDKDLIQKPIRKVIPYQDGMKRDNISQRGSLLKPKAQFNNDIKKKWIGPDVNATELGLVSFDDRYDEDYDVPAFLRKKAD
ncbi:cell division protein FtsZ [bacterium]|nr:cell division protein FtsZ [bacterium]